MAYPKWITPEGNLGIVPELEYYQFSLDAYDVNSGSLVYTHISGKLPPGIQVINTGVLQGIPTITPTIGIDLSQTYTFTIRVKNTSTLSVSDRTFNITITNIAPPEIIPKTVTQTIKLDLTGNITATAGGYLLQSVTGANAIIQANVINSPSVTVIYTPNSPAFKIGSGNLTVAPSTSVAAYPRVATTISSSSTRDLGTYFDGAVVNLQLTAIEAAPSATLLWTVKSGELPPGLSLSSSGLISGYIEPIPSLGPSNDPGWDDTAWDLVTWDFPLGTTSKSFNFSVEVFDGLNTDIVEYSILVEPKRWFTSDSTKIKTNDTIANGVKLSVDTGSRHLPIIVTTQASLPAERETGHFSFRVEAVDLDDDVLQYSVPILSTGGFDEQTIIGDSVAYIDDVLINNNLYSGVFPKTYITNTAATIQLYSGNVITCSIGDYITQTGSTVNARVTSSVLNSSTISVIILNGSFSTKTGNLYINGSQIIKPLFNYINSAWANLGVYPTSVVSGAVVSVDNTAPALVNGDSIQLLSHDSSINSLNWFQGTVNYNTEIRLTGQDTFTANVGDYLTQYISNANAIISNISSTTGTMYFSGSKSVGNITLTGSVINATIGDYITQLGSTANARVTANITAAITIPLEFLTGSFTIGYGNIKLNGANILSYPASSTVVSEQLSFRANIGDIITQPGSSGNAIVTEDLSDTTKVNVNYNSASFNLVGNIRINGANVALHPTALSTQTDVAVTYTNSNVFKFNNVTTAANVLVNGVDTKATPSKVISVGVTLGALQTQGTIGYDEGKYDQGILGLPTGISIDRDSGWMTGYLPQQTSNRTSYDFEVIVYKRDYPGYFTTRQYTLEIVGDLNNTIDWVTPTYLGTIENGQISELSIKAIASKGRNLTYTYTPGSFINMPQGLKLMSNGLITGRTSFELFTLDQGRTTLDKNKTTFDNTYEFSATASDYDGTVSSSKKFTIRVVGRNITPYENLYLKALPGIGQRDTLLSMLNDRDIFPNEYLYRSEDPYFGIANDIRTLFLPGLNPSTLEEYATAVETNHYNKSVRFGDIKTAIAVDGSYNVVDVTSGEHVGIFRDDYGFMPDNFNLGYTVSTTLPAGTKLTTEHVKYEVIYVEILDDNTNISGEGPPNTIDLTGSINPFYDAESNAYTIAYPNAFNNMKDIMVNALGYENKGALPTWMISKQPDGRIPGFTRAVVLAYTVEGASEKIAYRFNESGYDLNSLDFSVDRYDLDNSYSTNFDIAANAFITSTETTFDRFPPLASIFTPAGTVDYAVNIPYDNINRRSKTSIIDLGGMDGITSFKDGDTLVFYSQEFGVGTVIGDTYNYGWSNVKSSWGIESWDYDNNTVTTVDDLGWDASEYITGYNEHLLNPLIVNKRIGVWRINIDTSGMVTLTFTQSISYYESLYVRNGFTHGATNIFYDPLIKSGLNFANYSIIPQQIKTSSTRFDGGGTRFYDYRDTYTVPEQGDKYIKFAKTGVFT